MDFFRRVSASFSRKETKERKSQLKMSKVLESKGTTGENLEEATSAKSTSSSSPCTSLTSGLDAILCKVGAGETLYGSARATTLPESWTELVEMEVHSWWDVLHGDRDKDCEIFIKTMDESKKLAQWPRGFGAGEFLQEPILDGTPVSKRGVKEEWCVAAFEWLGAISTVPHTVNHVPTRIFVEAFVKLVTAEHGCALYFFLPPEFREPPIDFISHSWDCTLRSLMYFDTSKSRWLDFISVNQHRIESEIDALEDCLNQCEQTLLMIEGFDLPYYAIRPLYRSWCVFEVATTSKDMLALKICVFSNDTFFHKDLIENIKKLSMEDAKSSREEDKIRIDELVLERYGSFATANRELRNRLLQAFAEGYRDSYENMGLLLNSHEISRMYLDACEQ